MTDPSPEAVRSVAATAREHVLTAALRNHVLVQGHVPVVVIHHSTTSPLEEKRDGRDRKMCPKKHNLQTRA